MQAGRRQRWIPTVGLIRAIAALYILLRPHERLLLSNARMVTHGHSMPDNPIQTYQWLSDREAILLDGDIHGKLRFDRFDLESRAEAVIPGWSTDTVPSLLVITPRLHVSPDRQWVFWVEFALDDFSFRCGHLDGTHQYTDDGNVPFKGQPLWLSDSVHYLLFGRWESGVNEIAAYRCSVNHPKDTHPEIIPLPAVNITDISTATFNLVSDHRLLMCDWDDTDNITKDIKIVDVSLNTQHPSSHIFHVPAPPKAKIQELEFSPQGDRFAWLVEQEYVSPLAGFLSRWFPRLGGARQQLLSIWVCRLDGKEMPLTLVSMPNNDEVVHSTPDTLRWLPDGHRLSFIYKGALYTVPVD